MTGNRTGASPFLSRRASGRLPLGSAGVAALFVAAYSAAPKEFVWLPLPS
jgi:hypothetical protein